MNTQEFPIPLNGLDDRESTILDPNYSPNLRNVRTVRERMIKGPGSAVWAAAPANSPVRAFHQASFLAGAEALLMATQAQVYKYNVGGGTWTQLAGGPYNGAPSQRFSFATTQDRVVWSNGTDNIKIYDNSAAPTQLVALASPTVLATENRILALNTLEVDGLHNARVRWSVNGVITDWTGLGSGFLEIIQNSDDPLTGGFVLGNQTMLTKARWLIELVPTGNASSAFAEATKGNGGALVSGTGMIARYSVGLGEYFAFLLGPDDVYLWDGASLKAVGQKVYKTITSLLDYNALDKVQGVVHTTDSEYWLLVSETAEGGVFIYDYRRDRWFRDNWANVRALGVFRVGSSLLNTLQQSEFVIQGETDGTTRRVDPRLTAQDGASFLSYVETPDFTAQLKGRLGSQASLQRQNTLWRVRVQGPVGQPLGLSYSTDRGASYTDFFITCNAAGVATLDVIAPFVTIRFRIWSSNTVATEIWRAGEIQWADGGMAL